MVVGHAGHCCSGLCSVHCHLWAGCVPGLPSPSRSSWDHLACPICHPQLTRMPSLTSCLPQFPLRCLQKRRAKSLYISGDLVSPLPQFPRLLPCHGILQAAPSPCPRCPHSLQSPLSSAQMGPSWCHPPYSCPRPPYLAHVPSTGQLSGTQEGPGRRQMMETERGDQAPCPAWDSTGHGSS